jgi:hypothetical protein
LAAQGHLQQVLLNARFNGFAELTGHFKEAIGRAKTFDALVWTLVVVVFDPETDPFPSRFEAFELGAGEKLLPDALPKSLDFAQRHGMVWTAFEVSDAALFKFGLEAGSSPPGSILATIVSQHLFRRVVLADGSSKNFQDVFGGLAAEDISAGQIPGVIVHEAYQIGITATQSEREDVRLPHLVRSGPLEKARPHQVAPRFGRTVNQVLLVESLADGLGTGF